MEIELHTSNQAFLQLKSEWQALEAQDTLASPFNTWQWLHCWWAHYGNSHQLSIITVRSQGALVAIAPLYIEQVVRMRVLRTNVLRFIGSGGDTSPDYLNILSLPAYRSDAIEQIIKQIQQLQWQRLHLSDIVWPSDLFSELESRFSSLPGTEGKTIENTILTSRLPDSWQAYRMSMSRKRRKQINHRYNRLASAGEYVLQRCSSTAQVEVCLDALIRLHRERWKSKGEAGGFSSDQYVGFHSELIRSLFASDQLWLLSLTLNNEIIGVLYLIKWRNTLLFFQSGISPRHEALSPGHVLFTFAYQEAIEHGIESVDLLKGNYQYKKHYAKNEQKTRAFIFRKPGIDQSLHKLKELAKNTVKTTKA